MSRITGTDAANLIEAYNAVYAPQEEVELTEEQVQEDFENWVNSLVEEGHDLSEYTWEDMYEEYLNEAPIRYSTGPTAADLQRQRAQASPRPAPAQNLRGLTIGRGGFNIQGKPVQPGMSPIFQRPGATPARPAAQTPARPAATPAKPMAQAPARPAAAPARPATTTSSKPSPTAPVVSPIERRTPTSAELRQAQQARATGSNLTGTGALATRPATPAAAPTTAPATTPAPAATSRPNLQQSIRNRRLNMDLDLFDVVKGYLIDEGYADTEEEALVIMANMSEEWRESIIEQSARVDYVQDKFNRENEAKSGSAHTYIPGKQSTGQALQKAKESARQMGKLQGV